MDDNTKKNSWDDLLQDLGAKPDESAFERHQAPAQDIEPTVEWSEAEELVEETKASPGDWNSLAETLGLEVEDSPEPVEEPVAAKVEPPVVEKAKEPVPEKAAKKVVEEHGGTITISGREGEGCQTLISMPLSDRQAASRGADLSSIAQKLKPKRGHN